MSLIGCPMIIRSLTMKNMNCKIRKKILLAARRYRLSSPGADYEEQNTKRKEDHNPKENPHREKVGFPNDAKNDQEIGITNEAVCRDEEGTLSDVDND